MLQPVSNSDPRDTNSLDMTEVTFSAQEIADALGISRQAAQKRGKTEGWKQTREGKEKPYFYLSLSLEARTAVLLKFRDRISKLLNLDLQVQEYKPKYNSEALDHHFKSRSQKARAKAYKKADLLSKVMMLKDTGTDLTRAFEIVSEAENISKFSLYNWYYGKGGKPGVRHYERRDWAAVLVAGHTGRTRDAECDPLAWDFLCHHYLQRSKPSFMDSYRRLVETAKAHGWTIPSVSTLKNRLKSDIDPRITILRREGEEALSRTYPSQRRDKREFAAGEAVNGDGLKFDRLWVDWGDEILNTSTGWFWQDIYSGKILAWRIGKTENTDIFRLSVYDLTKITVPLYAWVDNTRVAANKAMTGQSPGRRRFKNKPSDAIGMLQRLGIEPRFTNPDHTVSNPGAKPIERAFGKGGIHENVATNPQIMVRGGYSKKTAIPVELFKQVVAQEIARHNARTGRRSPVCLGRSFDDVFKESFEKTAVRKVLESQRQILLLMQETVRVSQKDGMLALKAGQGPSGKNRYYADELLRHKGREVLVYYDPENISADTNVYTLDGQYICDAQCVLDVAFNDSQTAREWSKSKRRKLKHLKGAAKEDERMGTLEMEQLYPSPSVPEPTKAKVVAPKFNGTGLKKAADLDEPSKERMEELHSMSGNYLRKMAAQRQREEEIFPAELRALPGS